MLRCSSEEFVRYPIQSFTAIMCALHVQMSLEAYQNPELSCHSQLRNVFERNKAIYMGHFALHNLCHVAIAALVK